MMNKVKARVTMIRRVTIPKTWLCAVQILPSTRPLVIVRSRLLRIVIYANDQRYVCMFVIKKAMVAHR